MKDQKCLAIQLNIENLENANEIISALSTECGYLDLVELNMPNGRCYRLYSKKAVRLIITSALLIHEEGQASRLSAFLLKEATLEEEAARRLIRIRTFFENIEETSIIDATPEEIEH